MSYTLAMFDERDVQLSLDFERVLEGFAITGWDDVFLDTTLFSVIYYCFVNLNRTREPLLDLLIRQSYANTSRQLLNIHETLCPSMRD